MAAKKTKKNIREEIEESSKQSDWAALNGYVKDNPVISAAATGFVVLCVLAGLFYRVNATAGDKKATTQYAKALANEDPALRAAELAALAEGSSRWTSEALYVMGEAAYQARDFEKAKVAFEQVRERFPDAPFAPDAVEGLGYMAENEGDNEAAVALYREILDKWPGSFAGMRQELNVARCLERLDNLPEAKEAYETQVSLFPDSSVAMEAEQALERLRGSHPDLFPKEEEQTQDIAQDETEATEAVPTPVVDEPASQAPVPEAPPAQVPAPEAPAPEPTAPETPPAEAPPAEAPTE